jgi:hypothetical protein
MLRRQAFPGGERLRLHQRLVEVFLELGRLLHLFASEVVLGGLLRFLLAPEESCHASMIWAAVEA